MGNELFGALGCYIIYDIPKLYVYKYVLLYGGHLVKVNKKCNCKTVTGKLTFLCFFSVDSTTNWPFSIRVISMDL